jgi:hypothetical protein
VGLTLRSWQVNTIRLKEIYFKTQKNKECGTGKSERRSNPEEI